MQQLALPHSTTVLGLNVVCVEVLLGYAPWLRFTGTVNWLQCGHCAVLETCRVALLFTSMLK